ncbi:MAG: hypothetical protein ACE5JA_05785 [bacterium]
MPKRVVTMHELETTKRTLDRLQEATPDEIEYMRRYISLKSSGRQRELYSAFFTKLVQNAGSIRK